MNEEVRRLFHELADLSPGERKQILEQQQIDPESRAEIESLLSFDSPSAGSLTGFVSGVAEEVVRSAAGPEHDSCGPYRLVRLLGSGGMGAVYLGERRDGEIQQQVAVKLLRAGSQRASWRGRFLNERQLLASLHHPSIVHVIDAGHTGDDQPFLVMEYVEGKPIDAYAEDLDLHRKLGLFLKVCEAVSYAHRNLIIHRDLKPSNILVDASGQPKLLDFGIAKLLDAAQDQTQTGERLLTPEYASPEQIRGAVQTTATDIYSLGAVFYKLLTGRSPHASGDETREAMIAAICTKEPAPPSRLKPGIPRDLDFILAKALRKEPEERYPSVDVLADDLRAFLEWRPVRARSGNAWYRTRRFLRRYWVPATAAVLVIAGLSAGLYVANRERAVAQRRFQQVRELAHKFIELDNLLVELPGATKARNQVVSTSRQYLERLGEEALHDKELALDVAGAYQRLARIQGVSGVVNLGQYAAAEESLRKADVFVESVLAGDPANRNVLLKSAEIAHDRMILANDERRKEQASLHANKAAERLDGWARVGHLTPAEIVFATRFYGNVALSELNLQRFDDAVRHARRGLEISRTTDSAAAVRSHTFSVLANALRHMGDLDGALQAIRESRKLAEKAPYPNELRRRLGLYHVLWREGLILGQDESINLNRPEEAAAALQQALDLVEELARRDSNDYNSRSRAAAAGGELANILRHRDPRRALAVYEQALIRTREITNNVVARRDEVTILAGSSYPLRRLGRVKEAQTRLDTAFQLLQTINDYPAEKISLDEAVASALRALGDHFADTRRPDEAIRTYQELIQKALASKPNPEANLHAANQLSAIYRALAVVLQRTGRTSEAHVLLPLAALGPQAAAERLRAAPNRSDEASDHRSGTALSDAML